MNIYQKLIEVRKVVPYLRKENSGYQFSYVSSSQVLANLKSKMDELNLLLIPSVTDKRVHIDTYEKQIKGQQKRVTDYFTEIDMVFTWVNADNPEEKIECSWYGQGIDTSGEKGVGKAMTYAEKYFMLKFFNIPTDKDDPDSFQRKYDNEQKQSQKPQNGPQQEQPNWKGFWTATKELGYTDAQVREMAKEFFKAEVKSLKEVIKTKQEQTKFYKHLENNKGV